MSNFILQDLIRTWVRVLSGESGMSKNAQIQCIFWKCEQHKFEKNFPTHSEICKLERKLNKYFGER